MLKKHEKTLHTLAEELLVKETMTGAELRKFVGAPARAGDDAFLGEVAARASGRAGVAKKSSVKKSEGAGRGGKKRGRITDGGGAKRGGGGGGGGGGGQGGRVESSRRGNRVRRKRRILSATGFRARQTRV